MQTDRFEADVRTEPSGTVVLDLHGDIDGAAQSRLDSAYQEAAAANATTLVLNFTNTSYINSTGIALIVSLLARARAERRTVAACGLSDHYREIFEITRLADFMSIFPDEAAALSQGG